MIVKDEGRALASWERETSESFTCSLGPKGLAPTMPSRSCCLVSSSSNILQCTCFAHHTRQRELSNVNILWGCLIAVGFAQLRAGLELSKITSPTRRPCSSSSPPLPVHSTCGRHAGCWLFQLSRRAATRRLLSWSESIQDRWSTCFRATLSQVIAGNWRDRNEALVSGYTKRHLGCRCDV